MALAIIMTSICAAAQIWFSNQTMLLDAQTNQEALGKTQGLMETHAAQARADFSSLAAQSLNDDIYSEIFSISGDDDYIKEARAETDWQSGFGSRGEQVALNTELTDWHNAEGLSTCDQSLAGDWQHPGLVKFYNLGLVNPVTDIDVLGKKLYLTANSPTSTYPDLYIVDVSDSANPALISSTSTGPGFNAIHVGRRYAYAANSSLTGQLEILDVSDPAHVQLTKKYRLADVSGGTGVGKSVFYANKKVYLGTEKNDGPEFFVIDVSNPHTPVVLGEWEVGSEVNSILVHNGLAYVTNAAQQELLVLDVGSLPVISLKGSFSASGWSNQYGKSLFLKNGRAYFGRTNTGINSTVNHEFFNLDVSNPAVPAETSSIDLPGTSVNDILLRGDLAFTASGNSSKELQLFDVHDPASISSYADLDLPAKATALDCEGNLLYLAHDSGGSGQDGFSIVGPAE